MTEKPWYAVLAEGVAGPASAASMIDIDDALDRLAMRQAALASKALQPLGDTRIEYQQWDRVFNDMKGAQ